MAICKNRKGYFLLNGQGVNFTKYQITIKPKRFNNLILLDGNYKVLFNQGHSIFYGFKSAYKRNPWLRVTYQKKHKRTRLFRKASIYYTYTNHLNYYNTYTGNLDFEDVDSIYGYSNYTCALLKGKSVY